MRLNGFVIAASVLASLVPGAPVVAQDVNAIRTEVITVTPPEGWVLSVWQGGTVEVGEFTPEGQTGDRYVDLLGYSVLPRRTAGPNSEPDLRASELDRRTGCRVTAFAERPTRQGWVSITRLCIGRGGATDDTAELEFAVTTVTDQAIYRVWRAHRAPLADLAIRVPSLQGVSADDVDEPEFAALVQAWAADLEPDIDRREVCNLAAPAACQAFSRPLPPEFEALFAPDGGYIAGMHAVGLNTISRQQFLQAMGTPSDYVGPSEVIAIFGPEELDWTDSAAVGRVLRLVAYGQATDGGVLVVVDPESRLTANERTVLRARLVAAARQLQKPDRPPTILTISVPARP